MAFKLYLEVEDQDAVARDEEYVDTGTEALTISGGFAWTSEPGVNDDCLFETYKQADEARAWLMRMWANRAAIEQLVLKVGLQVLK